MLRVRNIRPRQAILLAIMLAATMAHAATLSTSKHGNFQRISLDFGAPVRMQVAQGGGSVTLTFNQPLKTDAGAIAAQLAPNVTSAVIGKDGKTVTIGLAKPYRVRQFISGNTVGIDILTDKIVPEAEKKPEPAPEPKPKPKPVEKPPTPKPAPVPIAPPKPAPEPIEPPKPAAIVPETTAPVIEPILTTEQPQAPAAAPEQQPEPATAESVPEAIVPPTEPATDPILTTKPAEPAPVDAIVPPEPRPNPVEAVLPPAAETKEAPEPDPILTTKTKPEPAPAAEPTPASEADATQTIEPEAAAAENALPPENPDKPFLVSVKSTKAGARVNFPFGVRTAAAVFERARDIWVVFSHEADAKPKLIASALPKQVVRVDQFRLPGATVLRFTTDGSMHATASQPKGGYDWNLDFGSEIPRPALEIPVTGELQGGKRDLLLGAFDITDPVQFYDPALDDKLIVVPAYEEGRGVTAQKDYPELEVLQTQQGAAVVSQRDDITTARTRMGVRLAGADSSLAVSDNLPIMTADAKPIPGISATADVLMPYDQWYVAAADFNKERDLRQRAIASATPAQMPASEFRMVTLYLGQGMGAESLGYLDLLKAKYPKFYQEHHLGVLSAAANVKIGRYPEAANELNAPDLQDIPEAEMWRQFVAALMPVARSAVEQMQEEANAAAQAAEAAGKAVEGSEEVPEPVAEAKAPPKPVTFDFLAYNKPFIRFYPPRIRQKMAVLAADLYLANNQQDEALKIYDTLSRDGILGNVQGDAEYTLGATAARKGKVKEALAIFDRLAAQYDNPYIQTRAAFAGNMLRYAKGMQSVDKTVAALESLRVSWRGDALQHEILMALAGIYKDNKRFDDTLRTWKYMLDTFPGDPQTLEISGDMAEMFENLFLHGLADEMPPLKSLALFYEFRELTPVGDKGDEIIQKLADRLAAVDLLEPATQLLEHQIKFRISGEPRARVGARLALLYLLNHQPNEALSVLEITNYGAADAELRRQRQQLTAQALSDTGRHEEALSILFNDDSREADLLKLDILWAMKDWPNVINQAEDILNGRANLTATLTPQETEVLMKLAIGYSFEADTIQLKYLRDYYSGLIPEGQYKEIFLFLTNDTAPLDPEDFALVAKQISNTETFLDAFRKQVQSGNLSEAVK